MTDTFKLSCVVSASAPGLNLLARVDDQVFFDEDPYQAGMIEADFPDSDGEHELVFELSGKTAEHTSISTDGTITQDLTVEISDLAFDEIHLGYMVTQLAGYSHDYNGTKDPVTDQFYGTMGCNGTVTLKFTTPIYLWLLENM